MIDYYRYSVNVNHFYRIDGFPAAIAGFYGPRVNHARKSVRRSGVLPTEPNCRLCALSVPGESAPRLGLFALKHIDPGTTLTWNYGLSV